METEQAQGQPVYGAYFRKSVSHLVGELSKLDFVSPDWKSRISEGADKLCAAESVAEQRVAALAQKAKTEWDAKYAKQVKAAAEQLETLAQDQARALREFLASLSAKR